MPAVQHISRSDNGGSTAYKAAEIHDKDGSVGGIRELKALKWLAKELRNYPVATLVKAIESAAQIKKLRTRNNASQAVFAARLNTSASTVQKWGTGQKKPNGPSLKPLSSL